uniref:O-acyltransferase WSD1 C-terminal domain-containing protein n=1 Tax=Timema tahoe TaxID=61484 RepID=A0A7R9IN91_9NEOP|nr:unnamed protein product [Timema tahoe]
MGYRYRRSRGTRSHLRIMAVKSQWILRELESLLGVVSCLYTAAAFLLACCVTPTIFMMYFATQGGGKGNSVGDVLLEAFDSHVDHLLSELHPTSRPFLQTPVVVDVVHVSTIRGQSFVDPVGVDVSCWNIVARSVNSPYQDSIGVGPSWWLLYPEDTFELSIILYQTTRTIIEKSTIVGILLVSILFGAGSMNQKGELRVKVNMGAGPIVGDGARKCSRLCLYEYNISMKLHRGIEGLEPPYRSLGVSRDIRISEEKNKMANHEVSADYLSFSLSSHSCIYICSSGRPAVCHVTLPGRIPLAHLPSSTSDSVSNSLLCSRFLRGDCDRRGDQNVRPASLHFSERIVDITRRACVRRLETKYPHLEVVRDTTVRSALDTRRNQGIVTVVLQVRGHCDLDQLKTRLQVIYNQGIVTDSMKVRGHCDLDQFKTRLQVIYNKEIVTVFLQVRGHCDLDQFKTRLQVIYNKEIVTVVLQVRGHCDLEQFMTRLQEYIVDRIENNGNLSFPHLRTSLTSKNLFLCWGRYTWQQVDDFSINNHLIVGNSTFRGRPVSELNIQEYVSETVSKYLPPEYPPWQITVIPSLAGQEERFYLVIRLHHLLLSQDRLGLGDLFMMEPERPTIWKRRLGEDDENPVMDLQPIPSPLENPFPPPVAIPKLCNTIEETIISCWNSFILTFDPLENVHVLKAPPNIQEAAAMILITTVAIFRNLLVARVSKNDTVMARLITLLSVIQIESEKRQCTPQYIMHAIINTLHPLNIILSILYLGWWFLVTFSFKLPLLFLLELRFLCMKGKTSTFVHLVCLYCALMYDAAREIWIMLRILFTAPRILFEDLFMTRRGAKHQLQTVSLCGRKVVAWSEPVQLDLVRRIASATGATPSEVLISAVTGALREYFRQFGFPVPDSVLCTARFFPLESLLTSKSCPAGCTPQRGGLLCLPLPTKIPRGDNNDPVEGLKAIQRIVSQARGRQPALYLASQWHIDGGLLTKLMPSLLARLLLNHLSRRYAVMLTEVAPHSRDELRRNLVWGQEIENIMYWRPPQANICEITSDIHVQPFLHLLIAVGYHHSYCEWKLSLSLTIMNYGDTVRLGVMSDALLSPQHSVIATGFLQQLSDLARCAGIPRDRSNSLDVIPQLPSTTNIAIIKQYKLLQRDVFHYAEEERGSGLSVLRDRQMVTLTLASNIKGLPPFGSLAVSTLHVLGDISCLNLYYAMATWVKDFRIYRGVQKFPFIVQKMYMGVIFPVQPLFPLNSERFKTDATDAHASSSTDDILPAENLCTTSPNRIARRTEDINLTYRSVRFNLKVKLYMCWSELAQVELSQFRLSVQPQGCQFNLKVKLYMCWSELAQVELSQFRLSVQPQGCQFNLKVKLYMCWSELAQVELSQFGLSVQPQGETVYVLE